MAESKVKRDNFICLQGWMLTDLELKGNELIVYACIYGFSQADGQVFSGSLQYLADWTNSSKQGVMKNLKALVAKGLIEKKDKVINGVKFCEYHATKFNGVLNKVAYPMQQSLIGGMQQSSTNNIVPDIKEDKKEDKERKKETHSGSYDSILSTIENDELRDLYLEYIKMRKMIKAPMTDRALRMLIDKVNGLEPDNIAAQTELLETAIINNWKSVYPRKGYERRLNNGTGNESTTGYAENDPRLGTWL